MSRLQDVPVQVETAPRAPTVQVQAILSELADLLRRLQASGEPGAIDVRSLPLFPGDYEALVETLGEGEIRATVQAAGPTEVRETALPGIWWVTHRNAAEEVMAELLEVTPCPEILRTPAGDLADALQRLDALRSAR